MRDMVCIYAQEKFNGREACRRYLLKYPNRRQPNHKLFKNWYDRLGETGSFRPKRNTGRPKKISVDEEDEVLVRVSNNPKVSSRRLSAATGLSKSSILRILKKERLYPYHFVPVHALLPTDLRVRLEFVNFIKNRQNFDPSFIANILFTDEATFTRSGVFNFKNYHVWETENPHMTRQRHFQHEFKINVWCGIIGNYVLGPRELPNNLNGHNYLQFLQNQVDDMLAELPLNIWTVMWFMQDGAPPHFSRQVRDYLDMNFPRRWIGRGSHYTWPPRSPDCNPMDFCVWGFVKSLVYKDNPETREELWQKIVKAVDIIRNEQILFNIRRSFSKRIGKCIEANGGHFEHLL
ncbi:uncharacterized protein [Onthophagus taurus]|uniref:uncharacterized protein n=1 Tax=Onthophagus taurus TaxID=166361 RepID=UPI0039BE2FFC